jgi:hypothetical protein
MIQCHTITVGYCFVHVLVTSVSHAFREPHEVLDAHRLIITDVVSEQIPMRYTNMHC